MIKKKIGDKLIAMILCVAIILSITVVAAGEEVVTEPDGTETTEPTPENPAQELLSPPIKVSDELLRVLKQLEGFNPHAYWDYQQYSIGYGSLCPKGYEQYYLSVEDGGKGNKITEEYAEQLLRQELDVFEQKINNFLTKNNHKVTQSQYDALVSFTYNTGNGWMSDTSQTFCSAVLSGDTGPRFVYAMLLWTIAGGRHILVKRRIIETNIYVNGVYPEDVNAAGALPDRYRMAFMNGNGGVVQYEAHGFDTENPSPARTQFKSYPTGPDETGAIVTYEFDGWYTQRVGGIKVEQLDSSIPSGMVLYAHWKTPGGTPVLNPRNECDLRIKVTVTSSGVNVRSGPDTYYYSFYKSTIGEEMEISEVITRGGYTWGRSGDKWIALKYTNYADAMNAVMPTWGRVTADVLNVRTGAGADYALVESAQKAKGNLILVSDWKSDGTNMWGKIDEGWVNLSYVTFVGVLPPNQTVQSIQVSQMPNKLSYVQMTEDLDVTGGKLLLTYADGSTATIEMTPEMVDGFNNTAIGTNVITVSYEGFTTTFEVQIAKAKVIFQLEDGTVLSEKEYLHGEPVEVPQNPTKNADETYTYVFAGWDKEVVPCAGNAVYVAKFDPVYIDYTVKFQNADGQVISEQTYHWGDTVTPPADPTKAPDETYTYAFAGWDIAVSSVCNGNATYTATYNANYIDYTITFQYEDGTIIKQYTLHYGDVIEAPAKPAAPEGYQFTGWDQAFTVCQGNAIYTAKFAPREHIPGDLDGNEVVNSDDVIQLLLHISLPDIFPILTDADYTHDGVVNSDDVIQLLLHISLPDLFPL